MCCGFAPLANTARHKEKVMASGHNVGQNLEMASDIKTSFQWLKVIMQNVVCATAH